ncbi:MAG TPA: septal ring lytic transglycosylase RlpA family protein [Solirubrobacteraceae bacterium]
MSAPIRNRRTHACFLLVVLSGLFVLPAMAWASVPNGGAGMGGTGSSSSSSSAPTAAPSGPVSASGDGITLNTSASTLLRSGLTFSGTTSGAAGKTIEIERLGQQTHWQWTPTVSTTVAPDGSFTVTWSTNGAGRFQIRALLAQPGSASSASAAPTLTVTVFRNSLATLYGPGFYGHRTACGMRLRRSTIGVASRTLRCGTKVAVLYNGRTMIVPVIDRGPYANHADWDLTMATGEALGDTGTAWIGAVSVPAAPLSASSSTPS